jgi:hypothetical protein
MMVFCFAPGAISPDLVGRVNKNIDDFLGQNFYRLKKENLPVDEMLQRVINLHYSITSLKDVFADSMEMWRAIVA